MGTQAGQDQNYILEVLNSYHAHNSTHARIYQKFQRGERVQLEDYKEANDS